MDINNLWSGYDLNSKKQNSRCLSVNTILEGKYLVGPVLGQGGFGITYVGYDLNMEAKIAIKEYFPVELVSRDTTTMHGDRVLSLSGEKSVTYKAGLKKYVAEAQNVSQFSEIPGVVSVKDFFYANETAYIVMEFIDGISLKDYLKEKGGRLSEDETLIIMKPVLEALVQVHKAGIIHRDISPDNIMLTFKDGNAHNQIGSVKLIDFGAARMTEKNDQKSLTIILKHGYAPEEQYRTHGEQGAWTDVYALCAVLYRMMTGETPVPAMDRMFKDELKTLEQCGAKISANTSAAILKGLAVKKEDRIQNVSELISALYEGAKVKPATSMKSTALSGKRGSWIIGIGVVCALAVLAAVLLLSGGKKKDVSVPVQENIADTDKEMDFSDEEKLGEQIVFYHPQRSISSGIYTHTLFCVPDGTVKAIGYNELNQCDVEDWDHVAAVTAGEGCSFGIRTDGTVLYAGYGDGSGIEEIEYWTDVLDIRCGLGYAIVLKQDGSVIVSGNTEEAELLRKEIADWENIKAIEAYMTSVYALTEDGTLLFAGEEKPEIEINVTDWDEVQYLDGSAKSAGFLSGLCVDGSARRLNLRTGEMLYEEGAFQYYNGYMGIKENGTIARTDAIMVGDKILNEEIKTWTDMQAVVITGYDTLRGFKNDGTIVGWGENRGNTRLEDFTNLEWIQIVNDPSMWDDTSVSLMAATKQGEILAYGRQFYEAENCGLYTFGNNVKWYNEKALLLHDGTFRILYHPEGELVFHGVKQVYEVTNGSHDGSEDQYLCYYLLLMADGSVQIYKYGHGQREEEYEASLAGIETWTDVIQMESHDAYLTYGVKDDGRVVVCSENGPDEVIYDEEDGIIKISLSNVTNSVVGLTKSGHVVSLDESHNANSSGMLQFESWNNIVDIATGFSHTVGLRADGTVLATGTNSSGQCDVEEWTDVVCIAAGKNCTIGITENGNLLIAGSLY